MMGVPTFLHTPAVRPALHAELAAHMRLFISGSAPLLAETHREFEARTGHRILERYGMTETNMNTPTPMTARGSRARSGCPCGVEVQDHRSHHRGHPRHRRDRPDRGARSQCVQKATGTCSKRPAKNCARMGFSSPAIWARSMRRDMSILSAQQGSDHLGGYNIYPKEIELLLDESAGVLESAVIGVPHADFGKASSGSSWPSRGPPRISRPSRPPSPPLWRGSNSPKN